MSLNTSVVTAMRADPDIAALVGTNLLTTDASGSKSHMHDLLDRG
jgi:hypothetical protein